MSSQEPVPQKKRTNKERFNDFISLFIALLVVFMIRSSLVEAFKIPSGSMLPTLRIGDHIFVNKLAYGLKFPFSDLVTGKPWYLIKRDPPKKGDVIVFLYPRDTSIYYIKRVVGVPGDVIQMIDKVLFINNKKIEQDIISDSTASKVIQSLNDSNYPQTNMRLFTEHLETVDHTVMIDRTKQLSTSFAPREVPQNHLFVMGDNRDWSGDSRYWGFVPMDYVKGKAMFVWLSAWIDFSHNIFRFMPERIGTWIN